MKWGWLLLRGERILNVWGINSGGRDLLCTIKGYSTREACYEEQEWERKTGLEENSLRIKALGRKREVKEKNKAQEVDLLSRCNDAVSHGGRRERQRGFHDSSPMSMIVQDQSYPRIANVVRVLLTACLHGSSPCQFGHRQVAILGTPTGHPGVRLTPSYVPCETHAALNS
ncbi:hypothetical protein VNO77_20156 [Canavalia gladiata]|uniref:Uncharacterized protein n=1 Tax=Canavalia gladiata TaxID=3824 RepID=A0AAN9QJ46_CANGL